MKLLIAIVLVLCACNDHDVALPYPVLPNVGSHAVAGVQQGAMPDAGLPPDASPVVDAGVPRPDLLTIADAATVP